MFRRLAVVAGSASLSLVQLRVADPPEAGQAPAGAPGTAGGLAAGAGLRSGAPCYAEYLALLAALDGRHRVVARLAGYAVATNRATGDNREANEAAAVARAQALAIAALGPGAIAALQAAGEALRDSQIVALVFGEAAPVPDRSTPY